MANLGFEDLTSNYCNSTNIQFYGCSLNAAEGNSSIAPWILVSGNFDFNNEYWPAHTGNWSIDLNGATQGILKQTVNLIVGSTYRFSFYLNQNAGLNGPAQKTGYINITGVAQQFFSHTYDTSKTRMVNYNAIATQFTASEVATDFIIGSTTVGAYGPHIDTVTLFELCPNLSTLKTTTNFSCPKCATDQNFVLPGGCYTCANGDICASS